MLDPRRSEGHRAILLLRTSDPERARKLDQTACPTCGAPAGFFCIAVSGLVAYYHVARRIVAFPEMEAYGQPIRVHLRPTTYTPVGPWWKGTET